MRRAIRLLLLVFTTLGALVVGTMWAVTFVPMAKPKWIMKSPFMVHIDGNSGLQVGIENWQLPCFDHLFAEDGKLVAERVVWRSGFAKQPRISTVLGVGYSFSESAFWVCGRGSPRTDEPASERPRPIWVSHRIFAPIWLVFTAVASFPMVVAVRRFRRWRRDWREGCCRECGYDLTGNESGICPECGKAIEAVKAGVPPDS